jgi:cytochrome c oxidase subunit 2
MRVSLTDGETVRFQSPQLHTWVGQQVNVELETTDVNHAFWIPGMRIKQDLLAGLVTNVRFNPIEPGVYRIVCAELCGGGHGNMAGEVTADGDLTGAWLIVHADEETYLNEFYYPELMSVLFPPEDPVALGRQVIQNYPCSGCHVLSDLGWVGVTGPSLDGIGERLQRLAATGYPAMTDYLHESIRHPGGYIVPGYNAVMPQFNDEATEPNYMSEEDLNAIIAYLLTQ